MRKIKDEKLNGINIYYDKNNQAIYYNPLYKKAYIISSKFESSFKKFQSRFIIPIVVFIFLYVLFKLNIYISITISLVSFVLIEYRFYKFLNNCTLIANFNSERYVHSNASKDYTKNKKFIIIRFIVYLSLTILLIVNANITPAVKQDVILKTLNYSLAAASLFFSVKLALSLIKK